MAFDSNLHPPAIAQTAAEHDPFGDIRALTFGSDKGAEPGRAIMAAESPPVLRIPIGASAFGTGENAPPWERWPWNFRFQGEKPELEEPELPYNYQL